MTENSQPGKCAVCKTADADLETTTLWAALTAKGERFIEQDRLQNGATARVCLGCVALGSSAVETVMADQEPG